MSLSTTSKRFLNTSRDSDSTTTLGSPFQCFTTLSVKKCFLISNLNLPWHNLRPFPLILSPVSSEKRPTPLWLQAPFRYWKRAIRSPLSPLFPRLNSPSSFSHAIVLFVSKRMGWDWRITFSFFKTILTSHSLQQKCDWISNPTSDTQMQKDCKGRKNTYTLSLLINNLMPVRG